MITFSQSLIFLGILSKSAQDQAKKLETSGAAAKRPGRSQPRATSRAIISAKPPMKPKLPGIERASGQSSCAVT